jgi:DNA-binding phage protein
MSPLQVHDVVELLRRAIKGAGNQLQWARQTGLNRTSINRVLNGQQLPGSRLCLALGLEWVVVRCPEGSQDQKRSVLVSNAQVILILNKAIKIAGGLTVWSQQTGIDRTYLSAVLHKRKSPSKNVLAALQLSEVLLRRDEIPAANRNRRRTAFNPHARWS